MVLSALWTLRLARRRIVPMVWSQRAVQAVWYIALIGLVPPEIQARPWTLLTLIAISALVFLCCYSLINYYDVSLKPIRRSLWAGFMLLVLLSAIGGRFLRVHSNLQATEAGLYLTIALLLVWSARPLSLETMVEGRLKARFWIPAGTRVNVQNLESVAPWYQEKLGFRFRSSPHPQSDLVSLRVTKDSNPIVLARPNWLRYPSYPMLFTGDLEKMREILALRGINVGPIAPDRQGTRTFEVRDPEDNVIDVVEK